MVLYTQSDYQALRDRALKLLATKNNAYKQLVDTEQQYTEKAKALMSAKEDLLIQESSIKILREIIDTLSNEFIDSIVDLVSYALKTIFDDRDYTFKVVLKEQRNSKVADFYLVKTEGNQTITVPIPDNSGGGITAVVGLVLQIFFIQYFKLNRVIFIDEGLSQVSKEYLPNLFNFMKTLCRDRGFKFLIVSHNPEITGLCDKFFEMKKGNLMEIDRNEALRFAL